jgi:cytochrome P450
MDRLIRHSLFQANTLAFGLLELARNPEFQEKLREEVNTRQGNVGYDSLPLLNAFIKV